MLGRALAVALAATAGLFFVGRGDWMLGAALFVVGNIGISASFVFYDSLLRTSRGRTRWTACRRRATRSATSAAACCSR